MAKSRSIVDKLTVLELVKFAILNDGDSGVSNSKLTGFVSKVSVQNRVSILTFKFAREFSEHNYFGISSFEFEAIILHLTTLERLFFIISTNTGSL